MRSEVVQSRPIILSSTHSSSLLRLALICNLYFTRKKCEKKKTKTQKSTHLIAKAIHSQCCHHKHSLCATKGQADSWQEKNRMAGDSWQECLQGWKTEGYSISSFISLFIVQSSNKNILRLCLAFQGFTTIFHGPQEDCYSVILEDQKMPRLVRFLNPSFQSRKSVCSKEDICILVFKSL